MSGVKEERSISLLLRLDLEFLESTPKTLINSLHATARNFDTPSYWTLTYQLHDSLKKELQDLGVTKIPSSNKIQNRIENLESEQAATVREKQELQKKQKTLNIIRQNFTALLNAPEMQIPISEKELTL